MKQVPIPRDVDRQVVILAWELDEFVVYFGLFAGGIITKNLILALVLIYFVRKGMRRLKSGLDGSLPHWFFWQGIAPLLGGNLSLKDYLSGKTSAPPYDGMARFKRT
ncbi:type IV conjugative transfer system protein TraL [Candidatus Parcubacteria bacterium]|nr:MAG: type IV conjugative transfer system protein TraL [Candidatus Parcubacteria bacterium]